MQLPAGEDAIIGDANFLDLLQIEEARTIRQRMESHDAHGRSVGIDDGEGGHATPILNQALDKASSTSSGAPSEKRFVIVLRAS
jgi:hypothetical protein